MVVLRKQHRPHCLSSMSKMEPSISTEPAQPTGFPPPVDAFVFVWLWWRLEIRVPVRPLVFAKGAARRRRSMYPSSQTAPTNLTEQAGPARPVFRAHPSQSHAAHIPVPSQPSSLPKRPKGQLFIGTMFFLCMMLGAYLIWNGAFRFQAYGVVRGRVLEVAPRMGGHHCWDPCSRW